MATWTLDSHVLRQKKLFKTMSLNWFILRLIFNPSWQAATQTAVYISTCNTILHSAFWSSCKIKKSFLQSSTDSSFDHDTDNYIWMNEWKCPLWEQESIYLSISKQFLNIFFGKGMQPTSWDPHPWHLVAFEAFENIF